MFIRRSFSLLILTALLLAACQAAPGAAGQPTSPPEGQGAVTATSGPGAAAVEAATQAPLPRLGAAALVVEQNARGSAGSIIPVEAGSGQPLSDYPRVAVGSHATYGFSSDRSEMAYLSYQPDECATYCLGVLNLQNWKRMAKPIPIDASLVAWFNIAPFEADSSKIVVIHNLTTNTTSEVLLADRQQGQVVAKASLPASIFQVARTPEGHIALYGLRTGLAGTMPEAYLALIDANDLTLLWEKTIPDVPFMSGEEGESSTDSRYYEPAAAFAPDGSKLYVAAADQPLLVTVDLRKKIVTKAKIERETGWLDRLMAATAGVVHAKSMNGVIKQGALSADGRYFYVAGEETREAQNAQGGFDMERIPLGLQVIDTSSGALVREIETTARSLSLSADGQSLLMRGWDETTDGNGRDWTDVLDLTTFQITHHLEGAILPSRLLDGSSAWMVMAGYPDTTKELAFYRSDAPEERVVVTGAQVLDWILVP